MKVTLEIPAVDLPRVRAAMKDTGVTFKLDAHFLPQDHVTISMEIPMDRVGQSMYHLGHCVAHGQAAESIGEIIESWDSDKVKPS